MSHSKETPTALSCPKSATGDSIRCCPTAEIYAYQVKSAYRSFATEVRDKFRRDDERDCSLDERKMCIASAQAIENLAKHSRTGVSPFEVCICGYIDAVV